MRVSNTPLFTCHLMLFHVVLFFQMFRYLFVYAGAIHLTYLVEAKETLHSWHAFVSSHTGDVMALYDLVKTLLPRDKHEEVKHPSMYRGSRTSIPRDHEFQPAPISPVKGRCNIPGKCRTTRDDPQLLQTPLFVYEAYDLVALDPDSGDPSLIDEPFNDAVRRMRFFFCYCSLS